MEREHKAGGWTVAAVVLILLLPLVYVLSIGPVIWLHQRGLISDRPFQTIYLPLEGAADAWPRLTSPLVWYVELWHGQNVGVPMNYAPLLQPLPQPLPPALPPAQFAPYQP